MKAYFIRKTGYAKIGRPMKHITEPNAWVADTQDGEMVYMSKSDAEHTFPEDEPYPEGGFPIVYTEKNGRNYLLQRVYDNDIFTLPSGEKIVAVGYTDILS